MEVPDAYAVDLGSKHQNVADQPKLADKKDEIFQVDVLISEHQE